MTRLFISASLILISVFSFALGIVLPLMSFDRLYFFTNEPSLLEIIRDLWNENAFFLALIVALVSVAFPFAKLLWLQLILAGFTSQGLRHLHFLARWSLMDVLVVALVVFAAKTSGLATALTEPGFWFYTAATIGAATAAPLMGDRGAGDCNNYRP